jgi:DNA-binding NarL/FixJ family response regulator
MEQMHQAGAESYVIKTAPTEELLAAIRGEKAEQGAAGGQ